jgi:hypothetical protein
MEHGESPMHEKAVKQGVSHSKAPKIVDKAINECKENLDVIMAGKVQEWLELKSVEGRGYCADGLG